MNPRVEKLAKVSDEVLPELVGVISRKLYEIGNERLGVREWGLVKDIYLAEASTLAVTVFKYLTDKRLLIDSLTTTDLIEEAIERGGLVQVGSQRTAELEDGTPDFSVPEYSLYRRTDEEKD